MFTIILAKSRFIDVTVTLSAVGKCSRRADYYEVTGVADSGQILIGDFHTGDLDAALATYNKWKGDPIP